MSLHIPLSVDRIAGFGRNTNSSTETSPLFFI